MPGPTRKPWKYSVDLDLNEIRSLAVTHVIVRIPAQTLRRYDNDDDEDSGEEADDEDDNQIIQIDAYSRPTRYKRFSSAKPWSPEPKNLRYHVTLDGVTDVVSLEIEHSNCTDNTQTSTHYAVVELLEPWLPGSRQVQFFAEK